MEFIIAPPTGAAPFEIMKEIKITNKWDQAIGSPIPMTKDSDIDRLVSFLKKKFPSQEAHNELLWIAKESLPISLIGKHITLKAWYHYARRTLSDVENEWS